MRLVSYNWVISKVWRILERSSYFHWWWKCSKENEFNGIYLYFGNDKPSYQSRSRINYVESMLLPLKEESRKKIGGIPLEIRFQIRKNRKSQSFKNKRSSVLFRTVKYYFICTQRNLELVKGAPANHKIHGYGIGQMNLFIYMN